ncbi:Vacuolar protein sorting-associated protein vps5 [Rhizina undulata]
MSSGVSPPLANLDLETDGSPWGDERSENTRSATAIALPGDDNVFKDTSSGSPSHEDKPPTTRRRPGRHVARVEVIENDLGPLGPLGDAFNVSSEPSTPQLETPPEPPKKEARRAIISGGVVASASRISLRGELLDSVSLDDEEEEGQKVESQAAPQMKIEPVGDSFDITVGDPHKVGDLTSAHTVYQVRTKTSSKAFKQTEFTVSRRYRDFLWLYNALNNNNPGVVVPPPPEKQAVGRFDDNFVESRRSALERMLNKTAAHPILQNDGDLRLFLESEALNVDIKHKEKSTQPVGESKGMFSSLGGAFTGGLGGKFVETDEWFHDRKNYLDALETQLKALLKAVDTVVKQRKDLAEAAADFSSSLHALSTVELSKSLSAPLENLSDLQIRIKELHERQAQQDVLTLGITVDEYIRLIGSIKIAFQQRQKAFHAWHATESELSKKKATYDKLLKQGKTQQDRLTQLSAEVADSEKKVHTARLLFEDMGRLMRSELERFEREKVEDFKSGVETFLESAVEAQKELIELWETYLLQLDREEEDEPIYRPAGETVAP